jgi:Fic family protein
MEDPSFRNLLWRSSRECIPWSEFLRVRLPAGKSAMETWDLLNAIRRTTGIPLPIPDLEDHEYWYAMTHQLRRSLTTIADLCRTGSFLDKAITETEGHQFLIRSRIDETIAAAKIDGLDISDSETTTMLRFDRAPRTANERLLSNTLALVSRLTDFVDRPFSTELLMELRDLVLEGVDLSEIETTPHGEGLMVFSYTDELRGALAERQLRRICAYANDESGDTYDHPIVRALIIRETLRLYRPISDASASVGRLAFRLYAIKHGLPVLGRLPISKVTLAWEQGLILPPVVFPDREPFFELPRYNERDLTPLLTISAQLLMLALRDVQDHIDAIRSRDEALRALLYHDPALNHRQRSILGRALHAPSAEFRIRYHQRNHGVAYTTARADLLELEEKGYLGRKLRGKAFVFTPSPDLEERIQRGGEGAGTTTR